MTRIERVAAGPRVSRSRSIAIGRIWFAGLLVPFCFASVSYGQPTYQVVKGFDAPFLNGASPYAGVIQAADGSFYGTTTQGGVFNAGTIFKLDAAGTLTTLHSFTGGNEGAYPYAGVIQATDGSFYGTTVHGGDGGAINAGTIFKLDAAGTLTTLHHFTGGSDGANPYSGLIQATDGSFYGTTLYGGPSVYSGAFGGGTIFKLDAAGTLTTLHRFTGGSEGMYPFAGMLQAVDGSFYGTTTGGGSAFAGTIYRLDATGTLETLHSFTGGSGGTHPYAGVIQATDGNFYGTTSQGGASDAGTVFKVSAAGTLTTLLSFASGSDVINHYNSGVIQATDGSFYGTTTIGGTSGLGTIFKLDGAGMLTTFHSFAGGDGGSEGANPYTGVLQATDGSFYGTTYGTIFQDGPSYPSTVFKLDGSGTLTTLHTFTAGSEGAHPYAGVLQATDGSFYGTTSYGGVSDGGMIFKLDLAGTTLTTLHTFTGGSEGTNPFARMIQATDGSFYGTTGRGGESYSGTVFKLDAAGTLTTLHTFAGGEGTYPYAGVIQATDGSFYGTTAFGGDSQVGTVFKVDPVGTLTTLHSFIGGIDGPYAYPYGGVIQATDGSFYGTTSQGGASDAGTVFKLDAAGTLTTLHSFATADGAPHGGLIQAADGSFYGTTTDGAGTIFKLDAAGTLTTLHRFAGGSDGQYPDAGVIQATDGSFYGTTVLGGASGVGTVFKLDGAGTLTTLHSFTGSDGAYPHAGVIQATDGSFYGTTAWMGPTGGGTVFRLTPELGNPDADADDVPDSIDSCPFAYNPEQEDADEDGVGDACDPTPTGPLTPTVTFGTAPTPTFLGGNFTVTSTTTNTDSSALSYSAVSGPCAVVDASAGTFSSTGAGSCRVEASGAATTNFLAASAQQDVTIAKASATVTLSNLTQTYTGSPLTPTATTVPPGLAIVWTNAPKTNAGSYAVIVTVNDANHQGTASGTFAIKPSPPTNLNAVSGKGKVILSWTQSTSPGVTHNKIYRSTTNGGPYTVTASIGANTSYTDTRVTRGTTYYYAVTAVAGIGESAPSNQDSAKPK